MACMEQGWCPSSPPRWRAAFSENSSNQPPVSEGHQQEERKQEADLSPSLVTWPCEAPPDQQHLGSEGKYQSSSSASQDPVSASQGLVGGAD